MPASLESPLAETTLATCPVVPPESPVGTGAPRVRILRAISELEDLRQVWTSWCEDPTSDIDSYLVAARLNSSVVRPHVMVLYRGGRPDCLLVGRLEHCRLPLKVGYTTLFSPPVRRLFFLQGGFMGNQSKENCKVLIAEILRCLNAGEVDAAELARIQEKSDLQNVCREELSLFSRGHFLPLHQHRAVKLPESYEAFFRGLSRKNRHELRRHERVLSTAFAGKQHIHCFRGEDELEEMAKEVDKISEKTYQRAIGAGFKRDNETIGFLRTAANRGGLRGCILYLEEKPCAFFIGNQYKNTFHANYMGFDPKFGKYSPGLSLLMHSIEESFEATPQATRIDFGWGDRQYKRAICNEVWQDGPIYLYAFSLRGFTLNFLRSGTSFLDLAARKLLVKFRIFQKTKKSWQSWLQRSKRYNHNETTKPESSAEEIN